MNNSTKFLGVALAAFALHSAASAANVGVSVNISQPGFYGRIDIGRVPAPVVIYPQPVIIEHRPVSGMRQPIYLHVPPGHEKKWAKHCRRYNACGQPVFFVQDGWYRDVYAPRAHDGEGHHDQGHRGHGKYKKGHD